MKNHFVGKQIAITTLIAMGAVFGSLRADVVNVTQGSTTGYELTDGNTYVIQNSVEFSNSTAGGSGMSVADGATVVIYIPKDVTLIAIGAHGSGQIGGGAGIRVPETATLVITGEGTVNATGGNAGKGGDGANGVNGYSYNYNGGYSGVGGDGGVGGGGAGSAIGGMGGCGGSFGAGAGSVVVETNWTNGKMGAMDRQATRWGTCLCLEG